MYIQQINLHNLHTLVQLGKVIVLYGARRLGKTTLLKQYITKYLNGSPKYLFVTGDDIHVQEYLSSQSIEKLKEFIGNNKILIIDEAQYIHHVGLNLKLIVDNIPDIKVITSGSSYFDLSKQVGEPLTGRQYHIRQSPLAEKEISTIEKPHEIKAHLETRLIYGSYPEVVLMTDNHNRQEYLKELINSYLFKDILELENIRNSDKLVKILRLIAYQLGKEVSYNELGVQLGLSKNTIEKYLDLLEKVFVVFKRTGFSRNMRKVISKNCRYYFYDIGIRNAIINNYKPLSLRDDVGQLWENYIISERNKIHEYNHDFLSSYFWRTYDGAEIDLIEEKDEDVTAYEIKWNKKQASIPLKLVKTYPGSLTHIIKENYLKFIL